MARPGGKDRGLFQRNGVWWVRWQCSRGHDHQEKGGTKTYAQELYKQRQIQKAMDDFCLRDKKNARPISELVADEDLLANIVPRRNIRKVTKPVQGIAREYKQTTIDNPLFNSIMPYMVEINADPSLMQPCIYFLCKGDQIVYVGKSDKGISRVYNHIAENMKQFDRAFMWKVDINKLPLLEIACIRYLKPMYNLTTSPNSNPGLLDHGTINEAIAMSETALGELEA